VARVAGRAAVGHDAAMALDESVTAPSRTDSFVRELSNVVGGPAGRHARFGAANFWTPVRVVVALAMLTFTLGFVMKLPCSRHGWSDNYQYTRLCYSDVYALYFSEGLNEGKVPYVDHDVEYPVVIGGLMWVAGEVSDNASDFFNATSVLQLVSAVAAAVLTARTAGRRRPWDAALFALAPGLVLHGTTNWDLPAVAFAAAAMYAWSRRQPELAGIWLGLAVATKLYPVLFLAGLFFLCLRARRFGDWARCTAVTLGTVLLVYLPVVLTARKFTFDGCDGKVTQYSWMKFLTLNRCRGADWDSLAYAWTRITHTTIDTDALNLVTGLATLGVVVAVGAMTLTAPRRPRVPQVLFLLVAGFLLVNKVNSPQYTIWLASRLAVALAGLAGAWVLHGRDAQDVPSWLEIWQNWDADLFVKVARFGYPPTSAYPDRTEVDFPAMPVALRLVHAVTGNWTVAGLVVSLVAGGVAACALYHLAAREHGPLAGRRAVLYLVCFPYAVFLFAGYSEALFLAFATTAWVYARKQRWREAALLTAGASFTRLLGLCLALGLGVEYLVVTYRAGGLRETFRPRILWLAAPLVTAGSFFVYQRVRTGHWDAYQRAQEAGWHRHTASVVEGFRTVFGQATNGGQSGPYAWSWRAEMLAVLGGAVLAVILLLSRRFGEAAYVGSSAYLLAAQNYYASSVRAALVWFPLYLLLAQVTVRRDWAHQLVVAVSAPLMVVFVLLFNQSGWVG
jgi:Gpi18-like mannosyltransferase